MNTSQVYIAISIVILAIIAILLFIVKGRKPETKLTKLAALALALIIAGIVFGDSRLVSYSFFGAGVILAIIDIARKMKK